MLRNMPRRLRFASGGYVYHVLNRAVARATLFDKSTDYLAFEKILCEARDFLPVRLLAYCIMPNHWHLVLWPQADGDLSEHMRWLTVTHTQRWHANRHSSGTGPLYQGRFKSFPIQDDDHLLTVCRYVERNALRAGLVPRAEAWTWFEFAPAAGQERPGAGFRPHSAADGLGGAREPATNKCGIGCIASLCCACAPYGAEAWQEETAEKLGLQASLRSRGRLRRKAPP